MLTGPATAPSEATNRCWPSSPDEETASIFTAGFTAGLLLEVFAGLLLGVSAGDFAGGIIGRADITIRNSSTDTGS